MSPLHGPVPCCGLCQATLQWTVERYKTRLVHYALSSPPRPHTSCAPTPPSPVQSLFKGSSLLTAASKLAETEVRRILRRVTAPANRKEAKQVREQFACMCVR